MLIVKTINSMEKVFPDTEPCENEVQNVILSNQKFNLQLAIKNLSDYASKLNTITVGGELAEYVSLRTVELVPASFLPVASDDYYISRGIGLYPDLLCPIDKKGVTIPAGQWKSVYVTIYNHRHFVGAYCRSAPRKDLKQIYGQQIEKQRKTPHAQSPRWRATQFKIYLRPSAS